MLAWQTGNRVILLANNISGLKGISIYWVYIKWVGISMSHHVSLTLRNWVRKFSSKAHSSSKSCKSFDTQHKSKSHGLSVDEVTNWILHILVIQHEVLLHGLQSVSSGLRHVRRLFACCHQMVVQLLKGLTVGWLVADDNDNTQLSSSLFSSPPSPSSPSSSPSSSSPPSLSPSSSSLSSSSSWLSTSSSSSSSSSSSLSSSLSSILGSGFWVGVSYGGGVGGWDWSSLFYFLCIWAILVPIEEDAEGHVAADCWLLSSLHCRTVIRILSCMILHFIQPRINGRCPEWIACGLQHSSVLYVVVTDQPVNELTRNTGT